jgi:glycine C-acetyltransferase/8-amino-7-oxononanoate synthase
MRELQTQIDQWTVVGLRRDLQTVQSEQGPTITLHDRPYLLFSSNNYLGLANHPALKKAAHAAIDRFGIGTGASRLISGNHLLFSKLEERLARFKKADASLIFNSGYTANLSVLPALLKRGDLVVADRLCHASLIDGSRLSGATLRVFRHNNSNHLEEILKRRPRGRRVLIVTEGVFSMEGDLAPLDHLVDLAERFDADIYLDDAHGTGVMGSEGRGTLEHFGIVSHPRVLQMGTFSKAFGSFGGYIVGSRTLIDYLILKARGFVYTTALPPVVVASNLSALELVQKEPERRERLWMLRSRLHQGLCGLGLNTMGSQTPILPVLVRENWTAIRFSKRLYEEGIFVPAIRPPTVPKGMSRLRFSVMATHTEEQIDLLLSKMGPIAKELRCQTAERL